MKLTCSQTELSAAMALVGRAVSGRPSHPILSNVLLVADAATDRLSLTGYDLSLGMQAAIPASVAASGAIAVPARLFGEIVTRLPDDAAVSLSATADQVEIASSCGRYQVQAQDADDFPDLPLANAATPLDLPAADLIRGIRATLFATSSDESKQLLTGIHLEIGAATRFAATDGHRLAVLELAGDAATADAAMTVPARSLRELERMISTSSADTVSVTAAHGQVLFACGSRLLTSRSLDGTYPNYHQLIPGGFSQSIKANRRGLIQALERVAVLADQQSNMVKLSIDPARAELLITADAKDLGSGAERLPIEASAAVAPLVIAFNVRYLLDGLKAMAADDVELHANSPTTPAVISGDAGYTYLAMPVQVRS